MKRATPTLLTSDQTPTSTFKIETGLVSWKVAELLLSRASAIEIVLNKQKGLPFAGSLFEAL